MNKKSHGGFTLIELAISMVFIAILSVTVVLLIQNVSTSYKRGMILNEVNTIGMDLIDDFRISVQNATSYPVDRLCEYYYPENLGNEDKKNWEACVQDHAASFTLTLPRQATVKIKDEGEEEKEFKDMPVYGAFCTGTYTYVWNSGYFESSDYSKRKVTKGADSELSPAKIITKQSSTASEEVVADEFRLLKIYDPGRSICVNEMEKQSDRSVKEKYLPYDKYENSKTSNDFLFDYDGIDNIETAELLKKNETGDLVLYDLYVSKPAFSETRGNLFYAASFILGTKRGGVAIEEAGNSCKPPSNAYSELEYCAINKFNFAVMAGGEYGV